MNDDEEDLAQMVDAFRPGLYRHFKGAQYLALCLAREDETGEVVVVYTRLYAREGLPTSTRRLRIWNQAVEHEGHVVPRFAFCGHVQAADGDDDETNPRPTRRGLMRWVKDNL